MRWIAKLVFAAVAMCIVSGTALAPMAILPWLVPLLAALVLVTYIPGISLWLPRKFF